MCWQALPFWQTEAAGVCLAYICPEVTARKEMMKHERYQIKNQMGQCVPGTVKLVCPWCQTNAYVLIDELNIHKGSKSLRYIAYLIDLQRCLCCGAMQHGRRLAHLIDLRRCPCCRGRAAWPAPCLSHRSTAMPMP